MRINRVRSMLPKIIWGTLIVALLACLIRVVIWEHFYYESKEGSNRVISEEPTNPEEPAPDETVVTDQDRSQHTVLPDQPRYLSISKLGIHNARILQVGTTASGALGTPANVDDVGWYRSSSKPGEGGTLLMDGHNSGWTRPGVFKRLGTLAIGDIITIQNGAGITFDYIVSEVKTLSITEADAYMTTMDESPEPGRESLSLITCAGTWSKVQQQYDSRVMLRAVLASDVPTPATE